MYYLGWPVHPHPMRKCRRSRKPKKNTIIIFIVWISMRERESVSLSFYDITFLVSYNWWKIIHRFVHSWHYYSHFDVSLLSLPTSTFWWAWRTNRRFSPAQLAAGFLSTIWCQRSKTHLPVNGNAVTHFVSVEFSNVSFGISIFVGNFISLVGSYFDYRSTDQEAKASFLIWVWEFIWYGQVN